MHGLWENIQKEANVKGTAELTISMRLRYSEIIRLLYSVCFQEHVTLHTGEAFLYSCPFCPKTFRSSANMYVNQVNKQYHRNCVYI